jgi:molecular chaperone GrpE
MQNQEGQTDTDRQYPVPEYWPTPAETDLEQRLASTEARLAETYDAFMRAKADGETIRRRSKEDIAKTHKLAVESFADAMVPVKASLEMALMLEMPSIESLKEGVETTLRHLASVFDKHHLLEILPARGERLDSTKHHAVALAPRANQDANTVVTVL